MNRMRSILAGTIGLVIVGLLGLSVVIAQDDFDSDDFDAEYVFPDGLFRFRYPESFENDAGQRGNRGIVGVSDGNIRVTIFSPTTVANEPWYSDDLSITELTQASIESSGVQNWSEVETVEVTLADGSEVEAGYVVRFEDEDEAGFLGLHLLVPLEDEGGNPVYALLIGGGSDEDAVTELAYAITSTLEVGEFEIDPNADAGTGLVDSLLSASMNAMLFDVPALNTFFGPDATPQSVLSELIALELVTDDGDSQAEVDFLSTAETGEFYLPEETESQYANVAGGALMSFRPAEENAICGFLVRGVLDEGELEQVLFIGVDTAYTGLILDYPSFEDPEAPYVTQAETGISFYEPHYLTYVLRDGLLTVWVDGSPILADVEINISDPEQGESAGNIGAQLERSCVMTSFWAYGFGKGASAGSRLTIRP